jgi:hypothetical protein
MKWTREYAAELYDAGELPAFANVADARLLVNGGHRRRPITVFTWRRRFRPFGALASTVLLGTHCNWSAQACYATLYRHRVSLLFKLEAGAAFWPPRASCSLTVQWSLAVPATARSWLTCKQAFVSPLDACCCVFIQHWNTTHTFHKQPQRQPVTLSTCSSRQPTTMASSILHLTQMQSVGSKPIRARASVVCSASVPSTFSARRAVIGAVLTLPLIAVPSSKALLLDEDDEDMIEKARANRKSRLATQKDTTRQFMKAEGLTNRELEKELIPVQKAVYNLAKSGSQLEAGDIQAVSATLSGSWVDDFKQVTAAFPAAPAGSVLDGLTTLKEAAAAADLKQSKQQFVLVASALESWAQDAGIAASLKGL